MEDAGVRINFPAIKVKNSHVTLSHGSYQGTR